MEKKYKVYKWLQYISLTLSFLCCLVPSAVAAFKIAPKVKTTESKWALGGIAIFLLAIIVIVVFRSAIRKYITKIPYTLTVLVSVGAMLLMTICLEKIIDDAKAILFVSVIGAAAGFVFELVSMYCKTMADELKEEYRRRRAE